MKVRSVAVVVGALTALAGQVVQGQSASGGSARGRDADLAAIEKLHQHDIAATLSRDPVALTALWTDDAVRLGQGRRRSRQASDPRQQRTVVGSPRCQGVELRSGNQRLDDLGRLGSRVGLRTGSYVESPGGEPKQILGTRLMVLKKMPDGSWKCFRRMGGPTLTAPWAGRVVQGTAASGGSARVRAGDLAAIEKLYQQDIAATVVAGSRCADGFVDRRRGSSRPSPAGGSRQASYTREERTLAGSPRRQGVDLRSGNQRLDDPGRLGNRVASLYRFVCRIAGWRIEAGGWHGARGL